MRPIETAVRAPAIRQLTSDEVSSVAGGLLPANIGDMPDRTVMCGTMWLLDRLLGRFFPRH
ncbi:MAG: hypothetical protein AB7O57_04890 [Hyphomicrobiaceae bacterium]